MVNSIKKGKRGEWELGVKLKEHGFGKARRGQQYSGLEADDVVGIEGVHIECKRVESININKAMKQSIEDAQHGDIPVVMSRKSKCGWLVTMRLEDWVELKRVKL